MYLCGHPGTGKTSSLNHVLSMMRADVKFEPLLFNAMTYPDVKSFTLVLYEQLHQQFFGEPAKRKLKRTDDDEDIAYAIERLLVRITQTQKKTGKVMPHRVIVIDEVDCFSHYEKPLTLLVKHILKPTTGPTRTCIIGIANSVDLPFRKKHSGIAMRDT
jgi:Cdc6-like AAA superfamily ATPase